MLILALVTKSANDAAVVAAEAMAKTEIDFAKIMTAKAKKLGMKRTEFRNASGLPNRYQKSTARDMATLARALIRDFPAVLSFLFSHQLHLQQAQIQQSQFPAEELQAAPTASRPAISGHRASISWPRASAAVAA